MLLAALLLAPIQLAQGYSPETEAVMRRSQSRAAEKRRDAAARPASTQPAPALPVALPVPREAVAKFQACLDTATGDPDAGIRFANAWRLDGGTFYARQCLGFAFAKGERWAPAQVAFEQAADEAEKAGDMASGARLWAQAGNAALAGGDAAKARGFFDAALARGLPDGLEKGEVHLDRARTLVALGDMAGARTDLDRALDLAPRDPLAWLLSATLARRADQMELARRHIAQAVKLSPEDASVALEEGNIAVLSGQDDIARAAWQRAVRLSPASETGQAAVASLSRLAPAPAPVPAPVKP